MIEQLEIISNFWKKSVENIKVSRVKQVESTPLEETKVDRVLRDLIQNVRDSNLKFQNGKSQKEDQVSKELKDDEGLRNASLFRRFQLPINVEVVAK